MSQNKILNYEGNFTSDEIEQYFKENNIEIDGRFGRLTYNFKNQEVADEFENKYNDLHFNFFENFITSSGNDENEEEVITEVFFDVSDIDFNTIKTFVDTIKSI